MKKTSTVRKTKRPSPKPLLDNETMKGAYNSAWGKKHQPSPKPDMPYIGPDLGALADAGVKNWQGKKHQPSPKPDTKPFDWETEYPQSGWTNCGAVMHKVTPRATKTHISGIMIGFIIGVCVGIIAHMSIPARPSANPDWSKHIKEWQNSTTVTNSDPARGVDFVTSGWEHRNANSETRNFSPGRQAKQ